MKNLLLIIFTSLVMSFSVYAEKMEPLLSQMDAYLVVTDKDGKENLKPAEEVVPKDKLEYQLTYTNNTEKPLKNLVITGPIPQNTFFVSGTNNTKVKSDFVVSIDGGKTFEPEPVKRMVMKDGKEVEVIIPPEKYTAIRWMPSVPITAKEQQIFTYRIEVK
ncbi:DUF11 domain-containing protein [Photobacterium andalusiense]|uniref:DUF11 domain-containing protein n=1 Tax=Photobacterium andalusiense TaxID=2204296 RepID=A0A1Y6MP32_9GAMM|nr:DUF11 domain-containing protein [Photobacterium andalusiense]SMY38316.1 hypothetical protein PAND9192_03557 [Photobacterium andalusiense]